MAQAIDADIKVEQSPDGEDSPSRRRLLVLIGLAVMLAVVAVANFLWGGSSLAQEVEDDEPPEQHEGAIVEITSMTANLNSANLRYARVSMAAVLAEGAQPSEVEQRFPVLQDAALTEITAMTPDEIRSTDGIEQLRSRLTAHAAEIYPDGDVLRILITDLVVQ